MCRDRLAADREGGWIEGKQKMKLMKSFPCGRVLVMAESQRVQRDEKSTTYMHNAIGALYVLYLAIDRLSEKIAKGTTDPRNECFYRHGTC